MATATVRISGPFAQDLVSASPAAAAPAPSVQRKPWYRRLLEVMIEARMAQAVREIERHRPYAEQFEPYRHLTASDIELAALRGTMADRLPLIRD